jgi:HSP20 family protein
MTRLMQYQPWRLAGLERQVDELFGALPYRFWDRRPGTGRWAPACDVFSRDGDLVVELDLPGIDPDKDVQVTVQDSTLCISGERPRPHADDGGDGYTWLEWRYGAFERGFMLPEGATGEGITASYRGGVLEVTVPKAAQRAEPRQIPVSTAADKNGRTAVTASQGPA